MVLSVLPKGIMGGNGWGVACGHIKAFGLFPFPHQRKICTEGLFKYARENTSTTSAEGGAIVP